MSVFLLYKAGEMAARHQCISEGSIKAADIWPAAGIWFLPLVITELSPNLSQQLSLAYLRIGASSTHKSLPCTYVWQDASSEAGFIVTVQHKVKEPE